VVVGVIPTPRLETPAILYGAYAIAIPVLSNSYPARKILKA
jgi:hypothetical protein